MPVAVNNCAVADPRDMLPTDYSRLPERHDVRYAWSVHRETMMRQLMIILVVAAGLAAPSVAAPCKDA